MSRRLSLPVIVGTPLLFALAGGAVGWFTADDGDDRGNTEVVMVTKPESPVHPLPDAPNPLDQDEAQVIGASSPADAIDVTRGAELELPLNVGASATAVDPASLLPAPVAEPAPIALGSATTADMTTESAPAPTATGVVRDATDTALPAPNPLRVSPPFAAASGFAALCDEVEAGNVPDPQVAPALRPTLAVLVNQPSTIAISGTWADGAPLEKATMATLPAHDAEWQASFTDTGEQRSIIACLTLPIDDVRAHAVDGVAALRASVLAIGATGQADLNATVVLNVPVKNGDPFFVEQVTIVNRGEQRRADGVLYPTLHVHYAFLSDAVVPAGSTLLPAQARVLADHAFVEGADCAGWAGNQQGVDRTHSGRFIVTTETRAIAGRDRPVTVVDGDVYLESTMAGGWEGSFCVRLQVSDQNGTQRSTLSLRGTQVRSPRTASYEVSVAADQPLQVSWTSTTGYGCAATTLSPGAGAQCALSARSVPDGIDVRLTLGETSSLIHVPVNTAYCNPDDPLDASDGCYAGFTESLQLPQGNITLRVVRTATPGVLWDDPSNAWIVGAVS